uniref:Uncharacterized protein n=1 Tax=Oryza meridionalis TaxID=40149 RepID=A0A0E0DUX2_9ORYZ
MAEETGNDNQVVQGNEIVPSNEEAQAEEVQGDELVPAEDLTQENALSEAISASLSDWNMKDKLFTITLDNDCSSHDIYSALLRQRLASVFTSYPGGAEYRAGQAKAASTPACGWFKRPFKPNEASIPESVEPGMALPSTSPPSTSSAGRLGAPTLKGDDGDVAFKVIPEISNIQYRKLDFEEFSAAAISVYQMEGLETWEQHARQAYEFFDKEGTNCDQRARIVSSDS